jgi:hypothetical protein
VDPLHIGQADLSMYDVRYLCYLEDSQLKENTPTVPKFYH